MTTQAFLRFPIVCPACGIAETTGLATRTVDDDGEGPIESCEVCSYERRGPAITSRGRDLTDDEILSIVYMLRPELGQFSEPIVLDPWDRAQVEADLDFGPPSPARPESVPPSKPGPRRRQRISSITIRFVLDDDESLD